MNETQPFIKNTAGMDVSAALSPVGWRPEWRLPAANQLPRRGLWESCRGCSPATRSLHWVKSHSRVCRRRCRGCREGERKSREKNLRRARLFCYADDKNFTPHGEFMHCVRRRARSGALVFRSFFSREAPLHKRHRRGGLCCWLLAGSRRRRGEGRGERHFLKQIKVERARVHFSRISAPRFTLHRNVPRVCFWRRRCLSCAVWTDANHATCGVAFFSPPQWLEPSSFPSTPPPGSSFNFIEKNNELSGLWGFCVLLPLRHTSTHLRIAKTGSLPRLKRPPVFFWKLKKYIFLYFNSWHNVVATTFVRTRCSNHF